MRKLTFLFGLVSVVALLAYGCQDSLTQPETPPAFETVPATALVAGSPSTTDELVATYAVFVERKGGSPFLRVQLKVPELSPCEPDDPVCQPHDSTGAPLPPPKGRFEKLPGGKPDKVKPPHKEFEKDKVLKVRFDQNTTQFVGADGKEIPNDSVDAWLESLTPNETVLLLAGDSTFVSDPNDPNQKHLLAEFVAVVTGQQTHPDSIPPMPPGWPPDDGDPDTIQVAQALQVAAAPSMCRRDDVGPLFGDSVGVFQGCWGGPSYTKVWGTDFPIFCPVFSCMFIDWVRLQADLAGFSFAFPFQFDAAVDTLPYHVPKTIQMVLVPDTVPEGHTSFAGGIGFAFTAKLKMCVFLKFGCFHLLTINLLDYGFVWDSKEAPNLAGTMEIEERACPPIVRLALEIEGFEFASVGLLACLDLSLTGVDPFSTFASAEGATYTTCDKPECQDGDYLPGPVEDTLKFKVDAPTLSLRPDAAEVAIEYSNFNWKPRLGFGLCGGVQIKVLTLSWAKCWPITGDIFTLPFHAISTPFPPAGTWFSLATDQNGDPMPQPDTITIFMPVDPAATALAITSPTFVVEGNSMSARLEESYDGSPIEGRDVTFTAVNVHTGGTVTLTGVTDFEGVARVVPPNGEYSLRADFIGSDLYYASNDSQSTVYVYRPTTFVIWGGNPGGVAPGQSYHFWGNDWWKQVTAGEFGGNASFLGFAVPLNATSWQSPPANSSRPPESLPDIIGVIVTTEIEGVGRHTVGNVASQAVLLVEDPAGYKPNPGHPAWGQMRAAIPASGAPGG